MGVESSSDARVGLALHVHTLGTPALLIRGEVAHLQPLPLSLLIYLAVEGPKPRRHLAELFWGQSSSRRNSLSSALSRIREVAEAAVWTVGADLVGTDLTTDIDQVAHAAAAGDVDFIARAYDGPFMANVSLRNFGSELEEWILNRRETTAQIAETSLLAAARVAASNGQAQRAADLAEHAWRIISRDGVVSLESLDEYHGLLAAANRPGSIEIKRQALELGVELAPPNNVGDPAAASGKPGSPSDQSHPTVFGFEVEHDAVRKLVRTHPISQLIGLGGSGKTLLASQVLRAERAATTFAQTVWVDLSTVDDSQLVEPAIAAAFDTAWHANQPLSEALGVSQPTLVVLDNFEQVLDAAPRLDELIEALPELRLLITSRLPLDLPTAATARLAGLPIETETGIAPAQELWRSSARRANADITEVDDSTVTEICALVGGLPLALELVGSWARLLPAADIRDSLRQSNELVDTAASGEQRSIHAIIGESVALVDVEDRNTLDLLAVFPAGLRTSDAPALGIAMKSVAALADRSMVVIDQAHGRITLHPLIAQYCREDLATSSERMSELSKRQATWCRAVCDASRPDEPASTDGVGLARIGAELPNIVAAWRSSAAHGNHALIGDSLGVVREFFTISGRVVEGQAILAAALLELPAEPELPDLRMRLLEANAWFATMCGQLARARSLLADCDRYVGDGDVTNDTRALVLRLRGTVDLVSGDIDAAGASFAQALALTSPSTPRPLVARLHLDLGTCHEELDDTESARREYRATLDLGRELDDPYMVARGYLFLARLDQSSNPQRCLALLDEALAVAGDHDLDQLAHYFPLVAGQAHLNLGDASAAQASFVEGLARSEAAGQRVSVSASHVGIAESLVDEHEGKARSSLREGIREAIATSCLPYLLWAGLVAADLVLRDSQAGDQLARQVLSLSASHSSSPPGIHPRLAAAIERHDMSPPTDQAPPEVDLDDFGESLLELLRFAGGSNQ